MNRGLKIMFLVTVISLILASMWNSVPIIKQSVESVLNPSLGYLLRWNLSFGFVIVVAIITFILTIIQKFTTDQNALKELKKEQKILQEEFKKYKEKPEKLLELQKKQFAFMPKTMDLTMKPLLYTAIPIILLFRWFYEYLYPIWGGWWILYYLIASIFFSSIFRKMLKVA